MDQDSGLSFYKGVGDATWYHSLFGSNVLALRVRAGGILGGAQTGGAELPPPQERLYAGGATSVRGFQQNEVGALIYVIDTLPQRQITTVNGKTEHDDFAGPISADHSCGRKLAVGRQHRVSSAGTFFPLTRACSRRCSSRDVGDVWTRENDTLHVGQELRWTPGFGIRFFSPVGPIQLNVGYNPYAFPLGPLYYSPGVSGQFALYCISPSKAGGLLPTDLATIQASNAGTGSAANCSATYAPPDPPRSSGGSFSPSPSVRT